MIRLRKETQRTHSELLPEVFKADLSDAKARANIKAYLPGWNPFRKRWHFAIGWEDDGALLGYLLYSGVIPIPETDVAHASTSLLIADIAVDGDARHRGIAQAMLAEIQRRAQAVNATGIYATVWAGNEPSAKLFSTAGYHPQNRTFVLKIPEEAADHA